MSDLALAPSLPGARPRAVNGTTLVEVSAEDGALARFDPTAACAVDAEPWTGEGHKTLVRLASGSSWHRVPASQDLHYEVRAPGLSAFASSLATPATFMVTVEEDGSCFVASVDGTVSVVSQARDAVELGGSQVVMSKPDGRLSEVLDATLDELVDDTWFAVNRQLDDEGIAAVPPEVEVEAPTEPEPEAEADPLPEPDPELEAEPEPDAEAEPEPEPERAPEPEPDPASLPWTEQDADADEADEPWWRSLANRRGVLIGVGLAGAVLAATTLLGGGGGGDGQPEEQPRPAARISPVAPSTEATTSETVVAPAAQPTASLRTCGFDSGSLAVTGLVTNDGDGPRGYRLQVNFRDQSGTIVAAATAEVRDVVAGRTVLWRASAVPALEQLPGGRCQLARVEVLEP